MRMKTQGKVSSEQEQHPPFLWDRVERDKVWCSHKEVGNKEKGDSGVYPWWYQFFVQKKLMKQKIKPAAEKEGTAEVAEMSH